MPYRQYLRRDVEYLPIDVEVRAPHVLVVADAHRLPFGEGSVDAILCSEVIEHVRDPEAALSELWRVLAPGGRLVLSMPFLARIHEAPNDYTRWTEFGLRHRLETAGFDVVGIEPTGGPFAFLGHQLASAIVPVAFLMPPIGQVVAGLSALMITLPVTLLDRIPGVRSRFPAGYVAQAIRR